MALFGIEGTLHFLCVGLLHEARSRKVSQAAHWPRSNNVPSLRRSIKLLKVFSQLGFHKRLQMLVCTGVLALWFLPSYMYRYMNMNQSELKSQPKIILHHGTLIELQKMMENCLE